MSNETIDSVNQELILSDGKFMIRTIGTKIIGDQRSLINQFLGSEALMLLPLALPPIHDYVDKVFIAFDPGNLQLTAFVKLEYMPFPDAYLHPAKSEEIDGEMQVTEYHLGKRRTDEYPDEFRKQKEINPEVMAVPGDLLKWRAKDDLFLMIPIALHRGSCMNPYLCYLNSKGEHYVPNFPNIFQDGKVCMGNDPSWAQSCEDGATVFDHLIRTLDVFKNAPMNNDLSSASYEKRYLRFDINYNSLSDGFGLGLDEHRKESEPIKFNIFKKQYLEAKEKGLV